ncbi:unnamed protein product, partial [Cercospora beticola]
MCAPTAFSSPAAERVKASSSNTTRSSYSMRQAAYGKCFSAVAAGLTLLHLTRRSVLPFDFTSPMRRRPLAPAHHNAAICDCCDFALHLVEQAAQAKYLPIHHPLLKFPYVINSEALALFADPDL